MIDIAVEFTLTEVYAYLSKDLLLFFIKIILLVNLEESLEIGNYNSLRVPSLFLFGITRAV